MNGAESLVRTLVDSGVDLCVTNPGTSEMHFVAALDKVPGMRCVLGLFEGVVTGAADGFYRMADRPAATLLHLGPGLANGLANLHNAKKAGSGIVNIVGEHATFHLRHDAPLTADVAGVARPMSHWVKTCASSLDVAADGALAVQAARTAPGQIATLILPADTAWNDGREPVRARPAAARATVSPDAIRAAAAARAASRTPLLPNASMNHLAKNFGRALAFSFGFGAMNTALDVVHLDDLRTTSPSSNPSICPTFALPAPRQPETRGC